MSNILYKLFNHRGLRILSFLIIFFSLSTIGILISEHLGFNEIYVAFTSLLLTTLFIENYRVNSNWKIVGIGFDKLTVKYWLLGFIFALIPMVLFLIIRLSSGFVFKELVLPNIFYLLHFSFLIFLYAAFEEILFRGLIFQTLIEKFNRVFIAIILSLIFASAHILNHDSNLISFVNTFFVGMLFSFMYLKTRTLWLPISFHFFWNLLQKLLVDANISGNYFEITIIDLIYPEKTNSLKLITGGYYGPEASVITTFLFIILFIIILKLKVNPYQSSLLIKRKYAESAFRHKK
jgi:membrane protease YdiL (CAAX protease family)